MKEHPPFIEMILTAIQELNAKPEARSKPASRQAIQKYILTHFTVPEELRTVRLRLLL